MEAMEPVQRAEFRVTRSFHKYRVPVFLWMGNGNQNIIYASEQNDWELSGYTSPFD